MRQLGWFWMALALGLTGCAPEYRAVPLGTASGNYRAVNIVYFRSDAPRVGNPDLSAFVVSTDVPTVRAEVVGYKPGKARRPHRQRNLSLMIAWDQSSSLSETDPERKRFPAVEQLVRNLPDTARLGLVNFASLGVSYADYDVCAPMGSSKARVLSELERLSGSPFSVHGTPLWNTLTRAIPQMLANEPPDRERWVVLFTDGQNEIGVPTLSETDALQAAQQHKVRLVFVLLGNEQTISRYHEVRQTLEYLANATGGAVVAVEQAQDLREAFGEVLETLEYAPCYYVHVRLYKTDASRPPEQVQVRLLVADGKERVVNVRW